MISFNMSKNRQIQGAQSNIQNDQDYSVMTRNEVDRGKLYMTINFTD